MREIGLQKSRRMFDIGQKTRRKFDKKSATSDASHLRLAFLRGAGGVSMDLMLNQSLQPSVGEPISSTFHRILVVDDNRDAAESLAMLLSLTGDETRIAYDGLEALQTAAVFRPDVMFVDLRPAKVERLRGGAKGTTVANRRQDAFDRFDRVDTGCRAASLHGRRV